MLILDKINAELDFGQEQQVIEALAPRLAEQAGGEIVEDDGVDLPGVDPSVDDVSDSQVLSNT